MNQSIEVLSVSKNKFPKYEQLEVAYKNLADGKVNGKKLMSFVYPEVFKALDGAQAGVKFDIVLEKEASKSDGKEYWQWTSAVPASSAPSAASTQGVYKANVAPKSNYETTEERAKRQVLIVRQSSLGSAIEFFALGKKTPTTGEVLSVAEEFNHYVFQTANGPAFDINNPLATLEDDLPF